VALRQVGGSASCMMTAYQPIRALFRSDTGWHGITAMEASGLSFGVQSFVSKSFLLFCFLLTPESYLQHFKPTLINSCKLYIYIKGDIMSCDILCHVTTV